MASEAGGVPPKAVPSSRDGDLRPSTPSPPPEASPSPGAESPPIPPPSASNPIPDIPDATPREKELLKIIAQQKARIDALVAECIGWQAAKLISVVKVDESGTTPTLRIIRRDVKSSVQTGDEEVKSRGVILPVDPTNPISTVIHKGTLPAENEVVEDRIPLTADASEQLRSRLNNLCRQRKKVQADASDANLDVKDKRALSLQLADHNAAIARVCSNRAVLEALLAQQASHEKLMQRQQKAFKEESAEAKRSFEKTIQHRVAMEKLLNERADQARCISQVCPMSDGKSFVIHREALHYVLDGLTPPPATLEELTRQRNTESVELSRSHYNQVVRPRAAAYREELAEKTTELQRLLDSNSSSVSIEDLEQALRERQHVSREFIKSSETAAVLQFALELIDLAESEQVTLNHASTSHVENPSKMLEQCREDLKQLHALLRKKHQEVQRAEHHNVSPAMLEKLRREKITLYNDVERLREHEAIIEMTIREKRHHQSQLQRERVTFARDLKERERMIRERDLEITELRRLHKSTVNDSTIASARATEHTARHAMARPQSAPQKGATTSTSPPRPRPGTAKPTSPDSLALTPPGLHGQPLTIAKVSKKAESDLVYRLYNKEMIKMERHAAMERDKEERLRKGRKVLSADLICEVNNRLFYSVPEHEQQVGLKLNEKYHAIPNKQHSAQLTPQEMQEHVKKLYQDGVDSKKATHDRLKDKHVYSKERKFPKFHSVNDQCLTVERLHNTGRGRVG
eukprot:Sspe_Gene.47177::Locus_23859_Transcript_1_1_Confidence_1.000_Length_2638::g.47177::m.47177